MFLKIYFNYLLGIKWIKIEEKEYEKKKVYIQIIYVRTLHTR